MKIPKTIIVGDNIYKIKMKRVVDWTEKGVVGSINYTDATMALKKTNNIKEKEATFFHELAHGILKELEFNHPKIIKFRNNESFVQELGLNLRKSFLDLLRKQEE